MAPLNLSGRALACLLADEYWVALMGDLAEERARRRWHDRQAQGHNDSYEAILADVQRRDKIDSSREHSPLRPAEDAIIIDTTGTAVTDIIHNIVQMIQNPVTSEQ